MSRTTDGVRLGALQVLAALAATMAPGGFAALNGQGFATGAVVAGEEILIADRGGDDGSGVVRIYTRGGDGWVETGALPKPEGFEGGGFGAAMAFADGRLLVTALNQRALEESGVHSYVRDASGWRHDGRIAPTDLPAGMILGVSVAMDGNQAAIGAASMEGGSGVLVFGGEDGAWTQEAFLGSPGDDPESAFGAAMAISGGTLVVGAPFANSEAGVAYVFERGADGWSQTGELAIDDGEGAYFGGSAAILPDRILIGAGDASGSLVSFEREDGEWRESGRLMAFDGGGGDGFGSTVAAAGETLWVAAPGLDGRRGAIYEFASDGASGWGSVRRISAPDVASGDQVGTILASGDGVLVSGMPRADYGLGKAIIFERDGDEWTASDPLFVEVEGYEAVMGEELSCTGGEAAVFGCNGADLVSFIPVEDLGGARGVRVNDVWGWTDPESNRDYAIVGRMDGTSFVDVTDPVNPVVVGNLPKTEAVPGSIWRDMKVFGNHVFIVADGAPGHGMQVFDLTRLRDFSGELLAFEVDAHYDRVSSVHNVVINEETGFAYAVGASGGGDTCGGGLHMIDINDPLNPTFAGCFSHTGTGRSGTGYSHDAQCVIYNGPDTEHTGREICLGSNEDALSIADVTDKENPVVLGRGEYPNHAYAHQGWLTEDHAYFYMNDELDEVQGMAERTRTLIWDVQDLDDPQLLKEHFADNASSDHNLYIRGNLMYQSNYNSGLRIFDISDIQEPQEVAFFDTVPGEDFAAMDGSWSNYPFFESGIILVTSGSQGLFLIRKRDRTPVS